MIKVETILPLYRSLYFPTNCHKNSLLVKNLVSFHTRLSVQWLEIDSGKTFIVEIACDFTKNYEEFILQVKIEEIIRNRILFQK